MLDSLDTLIAFVLIMLVASLLITIAVQMFAAALNLRGRNLLNGLGSVFAVIDPNLETERHKLADYLLRGRLLSDSFLPIELRSSKWPNFVQRWVKSLRSTSAVRPQELFDAIHRIAIAKEPADANLKANARTLLIALGVSEADLQKAEDEIKDATAKAQQISDQAKNALGSLDLSKQIDVIASLNLSDEAKQRLNSLQAEIQNRAHQIEVAFHDQVKNITDQVSAYGKNIAARAVSTAQSIDAAYEKFHYWTCVCEERAQQWFTMHTRILTVIFAFAFAFWSQLDTVEIFKLVSSNKEVRDKLVAQAATVSSQAEKTLTDSPSVLQKAYQAWLAATDDRIKAALSSVNVTTTDTRESVIRQLNKALADKKVDEKTADAAIHSFNTTVDNTVKDSFNDSGTQYAKVKADLNDTGFVLFPKGSRWKDGWSFAHLIGVLFSVGLLSLGAPFWYHSLKDLVSLRSQVAQNISDQQEQAQKQPDRAKPQAPPTVKP